MSESGYLDDPNRVASGNTDLAPTSLFSQLAQRQYDQQKLSQAQYDDPTSWHTSSSPSHHGQSSTSPHDGRSNGRRRRRRLSVHEESETGSEYSSTSSDRALQREWEEQLDQLKLMFQIIIFPFAGKFFGRKFSYFCKSPPLTPITLPTLHPLALYTALDIIYHLQTEREKERSADKLFDTTVFNRYKSFGSPFAGSFWTGLTST